MELITRTVFGSYLQTNLLLGLNHQIIANTTLNEKFGIQSGILPIAGQTPTLGYYAIGNGGHVFATGPSGIQYPKGLQHKATDAALFNHLPFVMRDPSNDLSIADQANYGLRREETLANGARVISYYLKRIPKTGIVPVMEYNTVTNGTTTPAPFVPDTANLNPTPSSLDANGVNVVTGDYVSTTATLDLVLTAFDAAELLNVSNLLYGTDDLSIISEIALCSGVDKQVSIPGPTGTNFNFVEVVGVQVCSFFACFFPMKYNNNGVDLYLDIGATEPLFALSSATQTAVAS